MNLMQRVQDILLRPKATWPVIADEPGDVAGIYAGYLVYLAAIPAIAGFIGLSLIGIGGFGINVRVPVLSGLVHMVVSYALSLAMVYVMALIVNALAPTFGGTQSPTQAFKLVAYAATAGFVGGIFSLLPALSVLGLLAALYAIYLIFIGVPVLMKCPPEKALPYTAVVLICGIVAGVVLGMVTNLVLPSRGAMMGMTGDMPATGAISINTPGGKVEVDAAKMEALARQMEEAGKRAEAAKPGSGDAAAPGKDLGEMIGAMTGAGAGSIAAPALKALLPEALGTLKRDSIEVQSGQAMGIAGSVATAHYAEAGKSVELTITDMGGLGGMAAMVNVTSDRETATETEKTYKQGARTVHESARKDGSSAEVTLVLANGVLVAAKGRQVGLPELKAIVANLNPDRIEALKREGKS